VGVRLGALVETGTGIDAEPSRKSAEDDGGTDGDESDHGIDDGACLSMPVALIDLEIGRLGL